MNKKIASLLLGMSISAMSSVAFAQFGGLGKTLGGGGGNSGGVSAEQIVTKYVGGAQSVMTANSNLLAAIGKKEESEKAALQATKLTGTPTTEQLEEAAKVQTAGSKLIEEELTGKKLVMDAEGKKKFGEGVGNLAKGILHYTSMTSDVKSFKPSPTALGGAAGSAIFIARNLPDSITNLVGTLNKAIEFSKANDIPVPANATAALN